MPTSSNQRAKLLSLMRILLDNTDERNPMTISEIISGLAEYGIQAERKSIYSDFDTLRQFGLDIENQRSKTVGYYVASRQFELPELKLLMDAVQSSHFITKKKSEELIRKLSSLTSINQAKSLRRQVYIADRAKTINETVYYSIDQIHHAINEDKKIAFKYFDYNINKNQIFRKKGELYQVTPVALCWNDNYYYLVSYSGYFGNFTHYRVDRMKGVNALDKEGDKIDDREFSIAEYIKRVFGMFGGEVVRAKLSFDESLVNVVLDHFGQDTLIAPSADGWFDILVEISISPVFLSWMFSFGDYAEIKEPDSLIEAMKELIEKNRQQYLDR